VGVRDVASGAEGQENVVARGPVGGFEQAGLVEPELVGWDGPAVSGLDAGRVHGRLYRPSHPHTDPPPLLVWVHGGPTGQMQAAFNARVAFFLDRGWAVLAPDHRGSTGWGRSYAQAMQARWGELDVADTAAGMQAAADRGWADPRRMVPIGGSAGGFTVLLLMALHPELCAAGVDLYGVADLLELDETTHRFEAHYLHGIVGPLPAAIELYRQRSPVNLADRIEAPLLILQGSADKVVPPAQSRAVADAVRVRGGVVEHHVYDDEGHGWSRPETVVDELERTESFLARHVLRWRA
jgi:dipeptidyl aminopeptidase/acylaminoacyl peptidase